MTESEFDVAALREWADTPIPDDSHEARVLFNQLRTDLDAAADYIVELEDKLADKERAA
jgi:hypothetical protein